MRWYRTGRTGGRPSGDRQRWTEPGCLVGRWSASRQPRVSVRAHGFRTNLWTLPRGSPHQAVDRAPRPITGPARAAGTASGGRRRDWPSTLGRSCQGENAIHTKAGRATSSLKSSARNRSTPAVSVATLPRSSSRSKANVPVDFTDKLVRPRVRHRDQRGYEGQDNDLRRGLTPEIDPISKAQRGADEPDALPTASSR